MTYINPDIHLLVNPKGVDREIQALQLKLQGIDWLECSFGRAFRQPKVEVVQGSTKQRTYYIPEVYTPRMEALSVMPNDHLQAASFFYVQDPAQNERYEPFQLAHYRSRVNLVVWGNLKKIDGTKDFRYTEELKQDVLDVIKTHTSTHVTRIFDSWENVFSNYTITDNYRNYMKLPFTGFRIEMDMFYNDKNC